MRMFWTGVAEGNVRASGQDRRSPGRSQWFSRLFLGRQGDRVPRRMPFDNLRL